MPSSKYQDRLPARSAGPEQLVALQTNGSPGGGGGSTVAAAGASTVAAARYGGGGGGVIPGVNDSPGAPEWGAIASRCTTDILPSRGFQKEFRGPGLPTAGFGFR